MYEPKYVYVCSPYRGDVEGNKARARLYAQNEVELGNMPFVPHLLYWQFLDEGHDRDLVMDLCLAEIALRDEVHVYGGVVTRGMSEEIDFAEAQGIPVIYMEDGVRVVDKLPLLGD